MKVEILLALGLIVAITSADQNEYTLEFEKVEIVSFNKEYVQDPELKLFKFNETSQGVNSSGVLLQDLGMDIKVNMDASKLQDNNEYKPVTMVKDMDMCDLINKNQFGLKDLLKYGNFTTCPWKKATYVVNNAMIDVAKLPPNAPAGKYIMNTVFFAGTTELIHTRFAGSVISKK